MKNIFVKVWYFVHGIACSHSNDYENAESGDVMICDTIRDIVRGTIVRLGF